MVILVTVTYNSSSFVDRLVDGVLNQTYKVDKLVIVDNASNSENANRLKEIAKRSEDIILHRLPDNLGGAGGFEQGMRFVVEKFPECEWIWLMDDDAYPDDTCLEYLLNYKNEMEVGCIAPIIKSIGFDNYQLYHHKRMKRYLDGEYPVSNTIDEVKETEFIEANSFVGPLIRKSVIDVIGYPNGDLFIEGDDTEYTYRMSRKYKILLVKKAVVNHRLIKLETDSQIKRSLWKQYYYYRNRLLFINKYSKNKVQALIGKSKVILKNNKAIVSAIINPRFKDVRNLYIGLLLRARKDGLHNYSGRTVLPAEYIKSLNGILKD